uniref:Structure-specific endonuclease subunit SLX4 n=1 Tax=Lygus hesperus TaxID=30085 RepID=A0A0A9Y7H8_LYGHE
MRTDVVDENELPGIKVADTTAALDAIKQRQVQQRQQGRVANIGAGAVANSPQETAVHHPRTLTPSRGPTKTRSHPTAAGDAEDGGGERKKVRRALSSIFDTEGYGNGGT